MFKKPLKSPNQNHMASHTDPTTSDLRNFTADTQSSRSESKLGKFGKSDTDTLAASLLGVLKCFIEHRRRGSSCLEVPLLLKLGI
jgi:hypothetical protein